ncbi:Alpha/Beta hydrolase protein [Trichophaea hybrida]|nr:Alpha/Beta hydrolase protein [Trichophaea hybrida]
MSVQILQTYFEPLLTALSPSQHHSLSIRLRLLGFQLIALLSYAITSLPYFFAKTYKVYTAPTRGAHTLRCLVFLPPGHTAGTQYPLHVCFHSGGFIGGIPESTIPFCEQVAKTTGSVVVAASYRFAPAHPFPAAVEDAEDLLRHLIEVGSKLWHVDTSKTTTSGFSAGGGLALGLSLHNDLRPRIKTCATFYGAIDMRTPRLRKIKPGMPKDPFAWVGPLWDTYPPPPEKRDLWDDDRLAPGEVEDLSRLPKRIMLVVAGIDILHAEQMRLAGRMGYRAEVMEYKDKWHGWLEIPGMGKQREEVFRRVCRFLKDTLAEERM